MQVSATNYQLAIMTNPRISLKVFKILINMCKVIFDLHTHKVLQTRYNSPTKDVQLTTVYVAPPLTNKVPIRSINLSSWFPTTSCRTEYVVQTMEESSFQEPYSNRNQTDKVYGTSEKLLGYWYPCKSSRRLLAIGY